MRSQPRARADAPDAKMLVVKLTVALNEAKAKLIAVRSELINLSGGLDALARSKSLPEALRLFASEQGQLRATMERECGVLRGKLALTHEHERLLLESVGFSLVGDVPDPVTTFGERFGLTILGGMLKLALTGKNHGGPADRKSRGVSKASQEGVMSEETQSAEQKEKEQQARRWRQLCDADLERFFGRSRVADSLELEVGAGAASSRAWRVGLHGLPATSVYRPTLDELDRGKRGRGHRQ